MCCGGHPQISSSAPWATIGPTITCFKMTPTASPPPPHDGLRDLGSSDAPWSNHHAVSELGNRPQLPLVACGQPHRGSSSSGYPGVTAERQGRPLGEPPVDGTAVCNCPSRGMRRCTNKAVRSTRISLVRWPYPAGGAQYVLPYLGCRARCVPPHPGRGVKHGWYEVVPCSGAASPQPPRGDMPNAVSRDSRRGQHESASDGLA